MVNGGNEQTSATAPHRRSTKHPRRPAGGDRQTVFSVGLSRASPRTPSQHFHSSHFTLWSSRRLAMLTGTESALACFRLAVQKHAILGADPACVTTGRTTENVRRARADESDSAPREVVELLDGHSFPQKEIALHRAAERIVADAPRCWNHPVTGHEKRQRIAGHHITHGTDRSGAAGHARQPGIGPDL